MSTIYVVLASCLAISASTIASGQITTNVFKRVLYVRVNAGTKNQATATAFTIDVDHREYLITAKHVVQGFKDKDSIEIFRNGGWSRFIVGVLRCEDPIDIAVLIPPRHLTVDFDLPFDKTDAQYGQPAYFLGFPYGLQNPASGANGPYPIALVKQGLFSGQTPIDPKKKAVAILLDGHNNPGFSGGPIVYRDFQQGAYVLNLLGVVSGFIPEVVPTMDKHKIKSPEDASAISKGQPWRINRDENGSYFEYLDNTEFVALNTGIVQGFAIEPAIDLIRENPVGPIVTNISDEELKSAS